MRATVSSIGSVLLLTGFAVFLIRVAGWPLPDHWPTRSEWLTAAENPLEGHLLRNIGVCAGWMFLGVLIVAILAEAISRLTRRRLPAIRLPRPIRALAAAIVGASIIGLITAPANAAPQQSNRLPAAPPAAAASAAPHTTGSHAAPATRPRTGTVTFVVSGQRYHVLVRHGDTLSRIARQWLGNADRWPEICRLNNHRHFAAVGGTLHDCDLIYPRWDLQLPADAHPPAGAVQLRPATPKPATPPAGQATPPPAQPGPTTSASSSPRTAAPSATTAAASPSAPTTSRSPAETATVQPDPEGVITSDSPSPVPATATPTPHPASPRSSATTAPGHGQSTGDSWLTVALAAALLAVAAIVVRRRRSTTQTRRAAPASGRRHGRFLRRTPNATARPMPYLITVARQLIHIGRSPDADDPTVAFAAELDADRRFRRPAQDTLPPAARGLVGLGAAAAARAALVETLSHTDDGALHGLVVTSRATLDAILDGPHRVTADWPQLHIADTAEQALDRLHAEILARRRTEDTQPQPATGEAAPAPVRLILTAPDAQLAGRLTGLIAGAADLGVTARLLGDWPPVVQLAEDGTPNSGATADRMAVLSVADTLDALALVREAATGTPDPIPTAPAEASASDEVTPRSDDATQRPGQKALVHVLGPLRIGPDRPGTRPHFREKAQELAVYLACRPDGVDVATVSEILFPDSTVTNSKTSVQQAASSLRKVLQFHNMLPDNPVLLHADRYRLNPDVVTVDLWQLHEHTRAAAATTDPHRRRTHLQDAVALGTGILGDGLDNDWIDSYRVTATITTVEAHLRLADDIAAADPQTAHDLLADAITVDPTNEGLYRRRMRLLAALGHTDVIPAVMRDLTGALADLDAQPEAATIDLAETLLHHKKGGPLPPQSATARQPAA